MCFKIVNDSDVDIEQNSFFTFSTNCITEVTSTSNSNSLRTSMLVNLALYTEYSLPGTIFQQYFATEAEKKNPRWRPPNRECVYFSCQSIDTTLIQVLYLCFQGPAIQCNCQNIVLQARKAYILAVRLNINAISTSCIYFFYV